MRAQSLTIRTYAIALAALMVALIARWLVDPILGDHLPLVTLYGAVAVAVWAGGYRPALLTVVLGYLACDYLFMGPRYELGLDSLQDFVGLVAYLVTCLFIVGLGETTRSAHSRAEEGQELLKVTFASIGDA